MRLRVFVLTVLLGVACGGAEAHLLKAIQPPPAPPPQHILQAKFVCGTVDGKWGCRRVPGGIQHGKGSLSGPIGAPSSAQDAPEQNWQGPASEACGSVEEKLSCKMRADGLKDCCCVLYDKM